MSAVLTYNGYAFPDQGVRFSTHRTANFSRANRRTHWSYSIHAQGTLLRPDGNIAALAADIAAMETALSTDGGNLTWVVNGTTVHSITSSTSMNGIRVMSGPDKRLDPPDGSRTEYLNKWTFDVRFAWDVLSAESGIVAFSESIRVSGGGVDFVIKESLTGTPQMQTTSAYTAMRAVQSGTAIGMADYVGFSDWAYPVGTMRNKESYAERRSPLYLGENGNFYFPTEWRYVFESSDPLVLGAPVLPSF